MNRCPRLLSLLVFLAGVTLATPAVRAAVESFSVLDLYREEMSRLVQTPGGSASVASGLVNPAAWKMQGHGGLYLALEDLESDDGLDDFRGVLSLEYVGFGMRRLSRGGADWYDYTFGLGLGTERHASALSYSWVKGADGEFVDSERLSLGTIYRWPWLSLGLTNVYDFGAESHLVQGDVGLRPFGPRWTVFADVLGVQDDGELRDVDVGYGIEAQVHPGVSLAVRGDDQGRFGLRVELGLGVLRPSARLRVDDDGDRIGTTRALEITEGPDLLRALGGGTPQRELHLKGPLAYRTYDWFDDRRRFLDTLVQINDWAADPSVERVALNLSGMRISTANLWELRSQLAGLRAQGKTVVLYFDRLGMSGFMLASVADELWMDPLGMLDLRGVNFGRTYYKRALEKAGIGFEEWRYFTYKSAAETLSRTSFSEADEEQWTALLEDHYEALVSDILEARGIDRARFERVVDEKGSLLAEEALALGLVDAVGDFHDMKESAADAVARPGPDSHVASLGPAFGDPVWRSEEWGEAPRIAVLYAIGRCAMDSGIEGRRLSRVIRAVREDPRVVAVVLRADSPGGDALPSDLVARELEETSRVKPVIVSQGQVAGSGGYWISMHGDRILASPFTLTGSIGVIAGHVWDDGLGEKVGMDYDHVQIGRSADLESGPSVPLLNVQIPHRPPTEAERGRAETVIRRLYRDFVARVAEGRGMSEEAVDEVGQGRVWSGLDGIEVGLVDELGGLWRAILRAKEEAGLEPDARVQIVSGPDLGRLPFDLLQPRILGLELDLVGRADGRVLPVDVAGSDAEADDEAGPLLAPAFAETFTVLEQIYLEHLIRGAGRPAVVMPPVGPWDFLPELELSQRPRSESEPGGR